MGCKDIGPFILSRLSTPTWNQMSRNRGQKYGAICGEGVRQLAQ